MGRASDAMSAVKAGPASFASHAAMCGATTRSGAPRTTVLDRWGRWLGAVEGGLVSGPGECGVLELHLSQ